MVSDITRHKAIKTIQTLLCLMREMAVTKVSIAEANSPLAASCTALAMAELDTVLQHYMVRIVLGVGKTSHLFRLIISSNSGSDRPWGTCTS